MQSLHINQQTGFKEVTHLKINSFDSEKKVLLLKTISDLAEQGKWPGIHKACKALNISPSVFYNHLAIDPEFKEAYDDAMCALEDQLAQNLVEQGTKANGITANIFLLKNIKRNRWNDGQLNLSVDTGQIKQFLGGNQGFIDAEIVEKKELPSITSTPKTD